ncbi:MAG: hypothetical protein FWD35_06530 [Oscillospiraceae bacterium]|nr:hypothetical protein [Oscillospiraceae bacterium]
MKTSAKIKTPDDVVSLCEGIARGYNRRKKDHESKRLDIIYSGATAFSDHVGGARGNATSDPVARKAERLEALESCLDAQFIGAVEQSLTRVGADVPRELREKLRRAVMLNCESGREFPFEILNIDEFSRRDFYRRRKAFIMGIGEVLGLV